MVNEPKASYSPGYQLFMLALSVLALAMLASRLSGALSPTTVEILQYSDFAICLLFLADFVSNLLRAPNRGRYLLTWGWLDLISSLPVVDTARWVRITRILRVVRILRGFKAARLIPMLLEQRRAQNAVLAASIVAIILVTFASIAVLEFEDAPGSNIKTAEDAVWWSFATITTVGYGDRYPVTTEGRLVAMVLMTAGVGLFGTFSASFAAWFIGEEEQRESLEIAGLKEEVRRLREAIESREATAGRPQMKTSLPSENRHDSPA